MIDLTGINNKEFILKTAKEILEFDSPTGFCFEIINKRYSYAGK